MDFIQSHATQVLQTTESHMLLQVAYCHDGKSLNHHFRIADWSNGLKVEAVGFESKSRVLLLGLEKWRCKHLLEAMGIPLDMQRNLSMFDGLWFPVLQVCAMHPPARDLLKTNPVLLWMMIYSMAYRKSYIHFNMEKRIYNWLSNFHTIRARLKKFRYLDIENSLHKKQKDIVTDLVGSGSKSKVRILKKIHLDGVSQKLYFVIFELLLNQTLLNFFSHWEEIPAPYLDIFFKTPQLTKLPFLKNGIDERLDFKPELTQLDFGDHNKITEKQSRFHENVKKLRQLARLVNDVEELADDLMLETSVSQMLCKARSVATIVKYHNELVARVNQRYRDTQLERYKEYGWVDSAAVLDNSGPKLLTQPPLPGTKNIIPVCKVHDLQAEGTYMNHCIASYKHQIERGACFVYRVLSPQRATLSIKKTYAGYEIDDLRLANNVPVSNETLIVVKAWLGVSENKTQLSDLGLIEWD